MFSFGGGGAGKLDVGARNEAATREALAAARIPVAATATGGSTGRTVRVVADDPRVVVKEAGSGERELFRVSSVGGLQAA
jgi:chemotaxis receptor (MCP) glutamine deamidase CheD